MTCNTNKYTQSNNGCVDQYGCSSSVCPDFTIRRNDTKPDFKVKIEDCDGPLDLTDLVLEASMWANGKLKKAISPTDTYIQLADNIGFNQIMVGDVIILDRPRQTEHLLVTAFDETNYFVQVQRGYHGTSAQSWKKGQGLKVIKFMNAVAQTEMIYQDVVEMDGTITKDVLQESYFVYNWQSGDTCLAGCYFIEFKLMKMMVANNDKVNELSVTPSFTDPSTVNYHCIIPPNIEWIRRFPVDSEGYTIKITDSPTSEM